MSSYKVWANLPGFAISISKDGVRCKTRKLSLEAQYTQAHPHPMRVLSRTGYRGWTYTDKRSPISLSGTLHVGEKRQTLSSPETLAFTDWSAGYMRRETFWSWAASAATLSDGTPFGMNLAAGVNETGFTENMIWLGEKPIHVGPVHFDYIQGDNQSPWRITSMDGIVDLTYTPEGFRDEKINAFVLGSLFTQLCGTFTGTITPPGEPPVTVTRAPGFCEDHFARW